MTDIWSFRQMTTKVCEVAMQNLESKARIYKALGHPTRLFMIEYLNRNGKCCVCELTELLDFDISTISKHLDVLKRAGLVQSKKEGQMVIYESNIPCLNEILDCIECISLKECTRQESREGSK